MQVQLQGGPLDGEIKEMPENATGVYVDHTVTEEKPDAVYVNASRLYYSYSQALGKLIFQGYAI